MGAMRTYKKALLLSTLAAVTAAGSASAQQVITLERAIEIGLERNPTLLIAENTSDLNAITVRQQQMAFYPNLSVSSNTSQSYGRSFNQDEGRIVNQTTNSFSGGLSSNVVLFNGFSNFASLQQARLNQSAGLEDVS